MMNSTEEDSTVYLQFADNGDLEAPLLPAGENDEEDAVVAATATATAPTKNVHTGVPLVVDSAATDDSSSESHDDDDRAVIDARRCNLLNGTWLVGFAVGFALQWLSSKAIQAVEVKESANDLTVPTAFALVFFSRYWVLVYLLPPALYAYFARRTRNNMRHGVENGTDLVSKKKRERRLAFAKAALEAFFECVRFQFGIFCGSLVLLNVVNLLTLATATPAWMLVSYYLVCVAISLCILRVLQLLVDSVCLHVSSVEVVVNYESDDDEE